MKDLNNFLETAIYPLFDLSDQEKQMIQAEVSILHVKSDSSVIRESSTVERLFFLQKGIIRSFYVKDDREINTEFFFENDFFTALTSFLTGEKTNLNFHTLEESELIIIPKPLIDRLLKEQKWYQLMNEILTREFIKKCRRESSFLLHDSYERYLYFLEQFPHSESRIPLFHIASYLGMSPETLSRIRSKKIRQIDLSQANRI
ncbi:Crp/Fnr family transcriptional regulator [Chryseobacterium sp. WLY505]|uniref:Crp/Fnr family transcriptional regulator n=1 Tax=Chryseobacterium sp. WLY505 TaxID=3068892 RepID=UPI0027969810|nr:Crp/Fnr family transcriptional regulator [Chryseobacterium sp. WLY505]MDQ1854922.1 Crp/Fnr family transcriptional regulator [Chryseobacterium sp. WLY505]